MLEEVIAVPPNVETGSIRPIVCMYHANCLDGFTSAWVVAKFYGEENVQFIPVNYGQKGIDLALSTDLAGRRLVVVDFSFPLAVMGELIHRAEYSVVLDHHRTAEKELFPLIGNGPKSDVHFDMERSGAGMTWDYFFSRETRPDLVNHVEDRDLWKFALRGTKEYMAAVMSYPYTFPVWDMISNHYEEVLAEGVAIERFQNQIISEHIAGPVFRIQIDEYNIPATYVPYKLASEVGSILAGGEPFAAILYDTNEARTFSLRSRKDGVDVSKIAKRFGGGGHPGAAGFTVKFGEHGRNLRVFSMQYLEQSKS